MPTRQRLAVELDDVRPVAIGVGAGVGAGAAVAASRRRTVVAAAAAPVRTSPAAVVLLPDLTVPELTVEEELYCAVVKNIGQAAAPESRLRLEFRRAEDQVLMATATVIVPPLAVNQSVRIRVRSVPLGAITATAVVDPDNRIAEISELNNDILRELVLQPEVLPDVEVQAVAAE